MTSTIQSNLPPILWGKILDQYLTIEDVIQVTSVNSFFRTEVPPVLRSLLMYHQPDTSDGYQRLLSNMLRRFTGIEQVHIYANGFENDLCARRETIEPSKASYVKLIEEEEKESCTAPATTRTQKPIDVNIDSLSASYPFLQSMPTIKYVYVKGPSSTNNDFDFIDQDLKDKNCKRSQSSESQLSEMTALISNTGTFESSSGFSSSSSSDSILEWNCTATNDKQEFSDACTSSYDKDSRKISSPAIHTTASHVKSSKNEYPRVVGAIDWRSILLLSAFFCHICLLVGIVPLVL